ncbi:hypothetical protein H3Z85_19265 [Chryseobacterium indologenes]|nr:MULTISPECIES: hypothetical protein [Chryseobacterium]MBF6644489.1 hypothetical protein [Chryseobacterium indologenes]MEB4760091.1 hypothetical protein [Chryseobacterium indologenes]QIX82855.1 hypothetical protein FOB56_17120 [Chryseobacterium indologenes]QPQ51403.1 hypothetical protein H3Z85_19265 [Chryseobacterium indologenes]QQQ71810.1 hypothetical protein JHW31_03510 [Chryseobacterium indologenes]
MKLFETKADNFGPDNYLQVKHPQAIPYNTNTIFNILSLFVVQIPMR